METDLRAPRTQRRLSPDPKCASPIRQASTTPVRLSYHTLYISFPLYECYGVCNEGSTGPISYERYET